MEISPLDQLARSINLRDLGGTAAANGCTVRRGLLYRSAALGELADGERAALRALGLRTIVDLRYNSERASHPTPWNDLGCETYWARDYEPTGGGDLSELLADEALTFETAHALMVRVYREMPFNHTEVFQHLFRALARGDGPVLFHCTSGKDRTGISTALILSAVGAPREAIFADYLASLNFDILASPAFRNAPPARRDALRPLFSVHRDYLGAMFEAVEARDGSVEGFLLGTLALHHTDLAALRERLLD